MFLIPTSFHKHEIINVHLIFSSWSSSAFGEQQKNHSMFSFDDWPMQNSQETLILQFSLLSSAWYSICSLWSKKWVSIHVVSTYNGCIHWWKNTHLVFITNPIWIILPIDLCDIVYFHPSPIPLVSVDQRRGWAKAFSVCKGSFSEGHYSWAEVLTCAHVYRQIIWMVGESGFWVIPTLKYQWGFGTPSWYTTKECGNLLT